MRISTQMLYTQFNYNLQNSMNDIFQTDEQLSSGQKLNKPSDDPAAVSDIATGKAELTSISAYQDTISNATLLLNATNTALDSLHSIIASGKQIAENAQSGTAQDLANYATMVGNLIQSAIGIANTKVGDRYIFSGYATDTAAVNTTTGLYQGTTDRISAQIDSGVSVDVNISGNELISSAGALDNTTIIGALTNLQTAIQANNQAGIQTALTALDTLSASTLDKQSEVGTRLSLIGTENKILTARDTDVTNQVSDKLMLSTVDIATLTVRSQQQQTALTSLRTITNGVLNTSLFDFLK